MERDNNDFCVRDVKIQMQMVAFTIGGRWWTYVLKEKSNDIVWKTRLKFRSVDISADVRNAAYKRIANKVKLNVLKPQQEQFQKMCF